MLLITILFLLIKYSQQINFTKKIIKTNTVKPLTINLIDNEDNFLKVYKHCKTYELSYQTFEIENTYLNNCNENNARNKNYLALIPSYIQITINQSEIQNTIIQNTAD